jgi:transposase
VNEQQLLRDGQRRLAVLRHAEEITGNVSLTCR